RSVVESVAPACGRAAVPTKQAGARVHTPSTSQMWAGSVGPGWSEIAARSIAISVDERRSSIRSRAVPAIRKYSFASIHAISLRLAPPRRASEEKPRSPGSSSTSWSLDVLVALARRLELAGARRLDVIGRLRRGARDSREQCGSQEDCQCDRTLHVFVLLRRLVRADQPLEQRTCQTRTR